MQTPRRWRWAVGATLVWALAGPAPTQSCLVDWKLFDGTSRLDPALCFYDASGVTRTSGHVGVWTKCIGQREINAIAPTGATGRAIAARNAQVLLAGYVPPAASLNGLDSDGRSAVISYESAADLASVKTLSAAYYDLDCARGTARVLRITSEAATAAAFRSAPVVLNRATPRGSGANLLQLVCGLDVAGPAPGLALRPSKVQSRRPRPVPVIHLAVATHSTRTHVAELTERRKDAPHRPSAPNRDAATPSVVASLRPRLS